MTQASRRPAGSPGPIDKAGRSYWDEVWTTHPGVQEIDPGSRRITNEVNRRFHEYFSAVFSTRPPGARLLEIGCAQSVWLPYFAREFGFAVTGIDYSDPGCAAARALLTRAGVSGTVVRADFFDPPPDLLAAFDLVVSFGVIEHFEDTGSCLAALAAFLKPGGIIVTNIPNLTGVIGWIQKRINPEVYGIHRLLSREALEAAHAGAGLQVLECEYFLATNFGVCNLAGLPAGTAPWFAKKVLLAALVRASRLAWRFDRYVGRLPASRALAPYINCVALRSH